jgi:pyridoxamine 5'-phosphate oxidase
MGSIADIRKEYMRESLSESDVYADPFLQFTKWWKEAEEADIDELNAMTLATAGKDGIPKARIVLLKDYSDRGFVFFTNYMSHKGQEMHENAYASLLFFWKELERQVRIVGSVEKVEPAESDEYFHSRPEGSRIGAWCSPQSEVIHGRHIIEQNVARYTEEFKSGDIPRPSHWGGYRVAPLSIEFWQGRPSRLHDRILYTKKEGDWIIQRLAP